MPATFASGAGGGKRDFHRAAGSFGLAERELQGFFGTVRGWLPWLLVFGVIAGLCGRVLALEHSHRPTGEVSECAHHHDDHDHHHEPSDDHQHDGCPPGPHDHHTHACCHATPLAGVEIQRPGLLPPGGSRVDVAWLSVIRPDEPVFSLDKPPLI
jgi:hypothetical protein